MVSLLNHEGGNRHSAPLHFPPETHYARVNPTRSPLMHRALLALAGLFGALGVATAAAGSHTADPLLGLAANFLLLHAPALIGLSLLRDNRIAIGAACVLAVGVILFAGDLAMRARAGTSLFPIAAPIGGGAMILGWLGVSVAALVQRR